MLVNAAFRRMTKERITVNARNSKLIEDRYQNHPLLGELKALLATSESFSAKAAAIKGDAHLSVAGRTSKTEKLIRATLRDFRDMSAPVDAKRAQLADIVARIKPTSFDRSDMAGALLRQEMRAAVRNMGLAERAAILMGEKADPAFVDSILEASPILSGVEPLMFEQIREHRLETLFSAESAQAESLTTEIEEAQAILELARQDVATASGLQPYEFEAIQKQVAERKDAVWLKRERNMSGDEVVLVVPPKGGAARPASVEEQREGKFYPNHAAWLADRAA
jgi:hypothetical protein